MKIDVIIPVYKPDERLFALIDSLEGQTCPPGHIILMNTEEKYFQQLIYGTSFLERHKMVSVHHLSKREFDHGETRRKAVEGSRADIFVMMTQDAMPANENLLEYLTAPLKDRTAVSYARQLPAEDCGEIEKYMRSFNYPPQSRMKSAEDLKELGIKTFFCSNVCAAYRRDIYEKLGGFVHRAIFNEDMIYAAEAIKAGYCVAYTAEACVIHSHNYTNRQQFHRNFDLGVSQAEHPEVFAGVSSESEGMKMILQATAYLRKNGMWKKIPHLYAQTFSKYAGYLLGKHYRLLPHSWILAFTDNREYWAGRERQ